MANRLKFRHQIFSVGDTIGVQQTFKEGEKTRSQTFEGILIAVKGRGVNQSFTVRKIASHGIGVERIWPVNSPAIKKITLKRAGKVRRAKLYYLRGQKTKLEVKTKEKPTKNKKASEKPTPKKTNETKAKSG